MNRKQRRATGVKGQRPDHGTFTIPPPPDEAPILASLREHAPTNTKFPGHWWARIDGDPRTLGGRVVEGFRKYHLDMPGRLLEITEEWDGKVTAKLTVRLDADGRPIARSTP